MGESLLILFPSTAHAMAMESLAENQDGRLVPLPSAVLAGCGFGWKTSNLQKDFWETWMTEQGILWQDMIEYKNSLEGVF